MLIYHPYNDANHCIYRVISILLNVEKNEVPLTALRLCDLYYLVPSELKLIKKWPRKGSKYYKAIIEINEQYEKIVNNKRIFFELQGIQNNTLVFLLAKGILCNTSYTKKIVKLNIDNVPRSIKKSMQEDEFRDSMIFDLITKELPKQRMNGVSGMKYKTDLMEYRYD